MMRITTLFLMLLSWGSLRAQTLTSLHHYPTHAYSIFDLHPSPLGGYLATVQVWDSIDVDPGPGAIWLETLTGQEEAAIVAYDGDGAYLWHRHLTSTVKVTIGELSFTEDGQFYASGTAGGTADVDPGPGVAPVTCNGGLNALTVSSAQRATCSGMLKSATGQRVRRQRCGSCTVRSAMMCSCSAKRSAATPLTTIQVRVPPRYRHRLFRVRAGRISFMRGWTARCVPMAQALGHLLLAAGDPLG